MAHDPTECMGCARCDRAEAEMHAAALLCPSCKEALAGTCDCVICAYCGDGILQGAVEFIGKPWHILCVGEAQARPGFLDPIEAVRGVA